MPHFSPRHTSLFISTLIIANTLSLPIARAQTAPSANPPVYPVDRTGATPLQGRIVTIPAGTQMTLSLETPLNTRNTRTGTPVQAALNAPVTQNGLVVLPSGSRVYGTVIESTPAGRFRNRQASLAILFNQAVTPDGQSVPLQARLISDNLVNTAYAGPSRRLSPVGRAAVGTLGGAAGGAALGTGLGAIVGAQVGSDGGGGRGAGQGAIYGTAIGAGVGLLGALLTTPRGQDIVLNPGQPFTVALETPTSVPVY